MKNDSTQLAILARTLHAIADEMGAILVRSAFSMIVREARDCSTALLDADGNVVAQAEMIPIHNGGLSEAFKASAAQLDLSSVGPDHTILLNDPYSGGQHLNDLILFRPIIVDGELLGWAGNTAHHLDVGGGGAGVNIDARELIQEGIVIPPMLIDVSRDLLGGPIERLIFANVRTPDLGRGDLYAQLAANRVGVERVQELVRRVGADTVRRAMAGTLDYAERRMRAAIATIPNGTWRGEAWIDSDVHGTYPLNVVAQVTVAEGEMTIDFSNTHPQVASMFNSSRSSSLAAAMSAIRSVVSDKDMPANDGGKRPIKVNLVEGSLLNPNKGLPVRARMCASYRIIDAVHEALMQAIPERVPAQGYNTTTGLFLTQVRKDAPMRIYGDVLGGGYGGAPNYDGAHALAGVLSSSRNTPIEAIELIHTHLRMRHYALVPDSGGAGQWRGGLGFSRAIEVLEDGVVLSFYSDHFHYPPRGKSGGSDAATGSLRIYRDGEVISLPAAAVVPLFKGDVVELSTGGGGGWGDPVKRPPDAVALDLADGLITQAFAEKFYNVARRAV